MWRRIIRRDFHVTLQFGEGGEKVKSIYYEKATIGVEADVSTSKSIPLHLIRFLLVSLSTVRNSFELFEQVKLKLKYNGAMRVVVVTESDIFAELQRVRLLVLYAIPMFSSNQKDIRRRTGSKRYIVESARG